MHDDLCERNMEHELQKKFPVDPNSYKLYEEVGEGVSATVYRALCIPLNEIVAIKVLDLEKCNNDLEGMIREVQTMSLIKHPNVLRAHCSFTSNHNLWVVMPYMAGGSCLHIMKSAYPEGLEEPVIATLLREVLKALIYLHSQGHIHRDVKAGNILIDANGAVKLADFGVSACMFDSGDRQRSRNTFVGTPCWMAPEVMQQLHGYDFKADIWSFGITALELAHGHAPFSKYPPMKVLLMTLQNAPPGLDYERDKRFTKYFKEMVAACLVKDPKKRPTAEKLLKHHPFFKHARSSEYLERNVLYGLSPLGERFKMLKAKESDFLLQNKGMYEDKEHLSQQEYIRGISGWNFNLDDLKAQAALLSSDGTSNSDDLDGSFEAKNTCADTDIQSQNVTTSEAMFCTDPANPSLSPESAQHSNVTNSSEDRIEDLQDFGGAFASAFSTRPLQALRDCFDVCEDRNAPNLEDSMQSDIESMIPLHEPSQHRNEEGKNTVNLERSCTVPNNMNGLERKKYSSGSLVPERVLSSPSTIVAQRTERDELQWRNQNGRNYSGPLLQRQLKDSCHDESSDGKVVQRKGRFKVTSAEGGAKAVPTSSSLMNLVNGIPANAVLNNSLVLPALQFLLQQNVTQREQLITLIKTLEQTSGPQSEISAASNVDLMQHSLVSSRERELQAYIIHLQQSIGGLAEELQKMKFNNVQLEREIGSLLNKDNLKKKTNG